MNIKQQNSVRIANSDPKIAKTRGFSIDLSCCGSSTSTEVINNNTNNNNNRLIIEPSHGEAKEEWPFDQ